MPSTVPSDRPAAPAPVSAEPSAVEPPRADSPRADPPRADPPTGFTLFWFGEGVSALGSATSSVLLPLLAVVALHAGPVRMGLLTASTWLPWLVIGLPAGMWLDRLPARPVMIVADLVSAAAVLTLPVAAWCGVLMLAQLLVVALVTGVATVFFQTGRIALLPRLVAPAGLERANSRLFGTESAVQVAGPGVAGAVLAVLSAAGGLLLDASSFLVSAVCLARLRERPAPTVATAPPAAGDRWSRRVTRGLVWVVHDRHLRVLMVIGGVSNIGLTGYGTLLVLYLVEVLGVAPGAVGVVLATAGVGGLVGAALVPRLARRVGGGRTSTALLLVSAPSALLIGLPNGTAQLGLTVAGLFLVAATVVGGNVVRSAWRQRYVPAAAMARIVTASQLVNYGGMPLAGLLAGALGAHLGVRPTVLIMAAIHALACVSVLATRFGRGRDLPAPEEFGGWTSAARESS